MAKVYNRKTMTWMDKYKLAKKYYEHYGDLNIPLDFKTTNGVDYDQDGFLLGSWIQNQRRVYKGTVTGHLTQKQIEMLDNIEMIWDLLEYNWNKMYELAKKYYEHYGNLNILRNFKTTNGIDYDESGFLLGTWIETQRQSYKGTGTGKLTQQRIELLDGIEMIWDVFEYSWNKMYELAKKYYEHYGNLYIPKDFMTTNGVDYDEFGIKLGMWLGFQRLTYKGIGTRKLTQKQIELLDNIEMIWDVYDYNWNKIYELAKKYYEHYGDLNIPFDFKTKNGIDYDQDGFALGKWLLFQRQSCKGLGNRIITQKQIEKLDNIEMIWDVLEYNWGIMYELAKKYYEYYGDLKIPYDFKTTNGIDYDLNGFLLGSWIQNQRQSYKGNNTIKITPIKIKMLEEIKMIWFLRDKTEKKLQEEIIDDSNNIKKQIEILNRFYSLLNKYNESDLPDKETINQNFMNQLNHKSLCLK